MDNKTDNSDMVRFEGFELDLRSGELLREVDQEKVSLPEQLFLILTLLLERQGQVVGREEIRNRLWPDDTVVEFEHSISAAMNRLRQALGDSANEPHYIETLARRGYRWKIPVRWDIAADKAHTKVIAPRQELRVRIDRPERRSLRFLFFAAPLSIAIAGWLLFLWYRSGKPAEVTITPVTSMPGYEWGPAFSPDGNEIAFVYCENMQSHAKIYVKALHEEKTIPLTSGTDSAVCPSWSPDGKLIAYTQSDNSGSAIFLVTPLGGARREFRRLSQTSTCQTSWSPDSETLAFGDTPGGENSGVFLGNIQTGATSRLTTAPAGRVDGDPAFSPRGDELAFLRSSSPHSRDLFIVSLSNHRQRQVTFLNAGVESPHWTSDGKRIVFCLNPDVLGERSLFSVAAAGGAPERLTFISSDAATPAISADGRLAYTAAFFDSNIWKVSLPGKASSEARNLKNQPKYELVAASSRIDMQPQLSPDGSRLVYVSDRDGSMALWISAPDGSNAIRLISTAGAGSPKWAPDGHSVVFDAIPSGHRHIYFVSANGGAPVQVTSGDSENGAASWSNDGKWIYFSSDRTGQWQIWKTRVESGSTPVQVTVNGGVSPQESADGQYLYYQRAFEGNESQDIWVMPTAGGKEKRVVESETWFWQVRKDGIYFIVNQPEPVIKCYRFATRHVEVIAKLQAPAFGGPGLSLSADERFAYYTQMDSSGADIMLLTGMWARSLGIP